MYLPLLARGFGSIISESRGLDSIVGVIVLVVAVAVDSNCPLSWELTAGGSRTRTGGLEDKGENAKLFGEGSRKAKSMSLVSGVDDRDAESDGVRFIPIRRLSEVLPCPWERVCCSEGLVEMSLWSCFSDELWGIDLSPL